MPTFRYNPELPFIDASFKGNIFHNGAFQYDEGAERPPYKEILFKIFAGKSIKKISVDDTWIPEVVDCTDFLLSNDSGLVWLGHSSFIIRYDNITILTDPIFFDIAPLLRRRHSVPAPLSLFKNIDYILEHHNIYCYDRGNDISVKHNHIHLLKMPILQISSTEIRHRIHNNLPIQSFVHDDVIKYIYKEALYK